MRRRGFITLAGGAVAWPFAARAHAQVAHRPVRLGFLGAGRYEVSASMIDVFREALKQLGYTEGPDYTLELRFADGRDERLPELARGLLENRLDVALASNTPPALALQRVTSTVPIVAIILSFPVELGLAESQARPGKNVTGNLFTVDTMAGKSLEFLRDAIPGVAKIGVLFNATNRANVAAFQVIQAAAADIDLKIQAIEVRTPDDIADGVHAAVRDRVQCLVVFGDVMLGAQSQHIAELALEARLPSMHRGGRRAVVDGGLMSYAPDVSDLYRRSAAYVDKIVKGAKPGDLALEFPTKFEFVVNLKTAKALGLTIPPTLLARASEVIE
jgi:putative ABC transport system substrate-binding protein